MAVATADIDTLRGVAGRLLGDDAVRIEQAGGGANSSIFRVAAGDRVLALKVYPQRPGDLRDRLDVEWRSLRFLAAHVSQVPRAIARDDERRIMLLEWLEGPLVSARTADDLDDAIDFMIRVLRATDEPEAASFPPASEACLSAAEMLRQVDARLTSFAASDRITQFLDRHFVPALEAARQRVARELAAPSELAVTHRRLIPADFGFHNAIRTRDGLRYIDFEYFGWDDPVKLIADFMLHPAMSLNPEEKKRVHSRVLEALAGDGDAEARLARHYPLYTLRWALIVLNPFRSDRLASLVADAGAREALIRDRLAKAAAFIAQARASR